MVVITVKQFGAGS